jgi:DNA-binding NtrC family response regulator
VTSIDRKTLVQTGLATRSAQPQTAARTCVARVVGDGGGSQVAIGARPVVIGAHGSCDLVIDDPQISRRHTELSLSGPGVRVRDLGSTNGTFWQSARISDSVVPPGSVIHLGKVGVRILPAEVPVVAPSRRRRFGALVGHSAAMREVFAVLELASPTEATILLQGPSGTGKELAARAVHDHSPRAGGELVVVDCGAIPPELISSHLFGHVRGAFTGADRERAGAFVEASGGTIFLDEIGELPLQSQATLLRVLEDRTVQPVGADRRAPLDVRVVAATHRNLAEMVARDQFRFDLFYRLAVVHVVIPALAERIEDLAPLIAAFHEGRGVDPGPIEGPNLDRLAAQAWPGNVRELRNVLERAWALSPGGSRFADLQLWLQPSERRAAGPAIDIRLPFKEAKAQWIAELERRYLGELFEACGGNISRTAEHAQINRRHLRELLRKHGLVE